MVVDTLFCNDRRNYFYHIYRTMTTMKKKTKNKKVNVTQTVVVNVGKGRRNVKPKVQAPLVQAPIVSQQVASQAFTEGSRSALGISPALNYHQMVYGNLPVPQMANIPGSYYGMMSPFNKPLHVVSEVQQAQLRQANELAGANLQRPMGSGKQEAMPSTNGLSLLPLPNLPVSFTPTKPFAPLFPMESQEPASAAASSSSSAGAASSAASSAEPMSPPPRGFDYRNVTLAQLNSLGYNKRLVGQSELPTLRQLASYLNIPVGREIDTKDKLITLISSNLGLNK